MGLAHGRSALLKRVGPLLLLAVVTGLIPLRALLRGEVLVPATLLRHLAPWSEGLQASDRLPWNPLMYDSVGQFYPWRDFAGRTYRDGLIPLWNPHQFCGTPFLANSQSAVLYPGNLLFWLLPADVAAGPSAWLHLFLAAAFMWVFLRGYRLGNIAALTGGIAYAFSAWQVSWLLLPTFLCTSCWLPLCAHMVRRTVDTSSWKAATGLAASTAMALLGGHLQIAFYVLLVVLGLATWELVAGARTGVRGWQRRTAAVTAAIACAVLLASAQLLPAVEFSRVSHRAGPATSEGYAAYVGYSLGVSQLTTLFLPDYLGNPSRADLPYRGASRAGALFNYAEGALYVGLCTLILAGYALVRRRQAALPLGFFAAMAAISLLLAFGTPLNALFYFGIPGFAQSGSPGRVLVLWSFAVAVLAAAGLNKLLDDEASPVRSALLAVVTVAALVGAVFWWGARSAVAVPEDLASAYTGDLGRQAGLFVLSGALVLAAASGWARQGWRRTLLPCLLLADLVAAGFNFNPSAARNEVYPPTPLTSRLRQEAGHNRIAPINRSWSFAGPRAVLPPNAALVYGLHDVQGYDSLFWRGYKRVLNDANGRDSSPPEVGNMVFAQREDSQWWRRMGVTHLVQLPEEVPATGSAETIGDVLVIPVAQAPGRAYIAGSSGATGRVRWLEDRSTRVVLQVDSERGGWLHLADARLPGWSATVNGKPVVVDSAEGIFRRVPVPAGRSVVSFRYEPVAFRVGLYLMLLSLAGLATGLAVAHRRRAPEEP